MIVVMSGSGKENRPDGNVVEKGTHSELMQKRGAYYKLYTQMRHDDSNARGYREFIRDMFTFK